MDASAVAGRKPRARHRGDARTKTRRRNEPRGGPTPHVRDHRCKQGVGPGVCRLRRCCCRLCLRRCRRLLRRFVRTPLWTCRCRRRRRCFRCPSFRVLVFAVLVFALSVPPLFALLVFALSSAPLLFALLVLVRGLLSVPLLLLTPALLLLLSRAGARRTTARKREATHRRARRDP